MSAARPDATADPRPVEPVSGPIDATVRVPGSKSITNRALILAALANGKCTLRGALWADDTQVMVDSLQKLSRETPSAEMIVDLEAMMVRAGSLNARVQMPESRRRSLVEGTWDSTALLMANAGLVSAAAARLPHPSRPN